MPYKSTLTEVAALHFSKPIPAYSNLFSSDRVEPKVESLSPHSHPYSTGGRYKRPHTYTLPKITYVTEYDLFFPGSMKDQIKQVIFNDPATVIMWEDGTKTIVKCMDGEEFDPYYGFCAAVCKKLFGGSNAIRRAAGLPKQKREKKEVAE